MGRTLTRAALLAEIDLEFDKLAPLIARVSARDLRGSCVNSGRWSLKDVLAHVADWARRCAEWCQAGLRGENPDVPAPGLKWNQFPLLNQQIYRRHRDRPAATIIREFHHGHARLRALAATLDEASLCKPRRFAWTGPTWAVANHIRANTASHYRWAVKHFRRWLASHATAGARTATHRTPQPGASRASRRRVRRDRAVEPARGSPVRVATRSAELQRAASRTKSPRRTRGSGRT